MSTHKFLFKTVGVMLLSIAGAVASGDLLAGELFEPQNSRLTQSSQAPGSRQFVATNDETAVAVNERYVSKPVSHRTGNTAGSRKLFATTDRQAIAQWLVKAEHAQVANTQALTVGGLPALRHAGFNHQTVPARVTYSSGPFYFN